MESYSSWLRGSPAKGLGREIDAWVQIPPTPLSYYIAKSLTLGDMSCMQFKNGFC